MRILQASILGDARIDSGREEKSSTVREIWSSERKSRMGKQSVFFIVPLLVYLSITVSTFPSSVPQSAPASSYGCGASSQLPIPPGIGCFLYYLRWGDHEFQELGGEATNRMRMGQFNKPFKKNRCSFRHLSRIFLIA